MLTTSLEVLKKKVIPNADKDIDRCIAIPQRAIGQAAALTHRLLTFARRQPLHPAPADINALLVGMEDLIRRSVGASVHVDVRCQDNVGMVLVDSNQLETALLNLCINARDAMPGGGLLTIETTVQRIDEAMSAQRNLPAGQYVCLRVADTGTGMTPDVLARVFEPFFTTKPVGEGTGLGLSMVYGFARQSGGQVWVDSEPGRGTAIGICLPCCVDDTSQE